MVKRCIEKGCIISASYGFKGKSREYCLTHSSKGMINCCQRCCIIDDCMEKASYGLKNEEPKNTHCIYHKSDDMVRIMTMGQKRKKKNYCKRRKGVKSGQFKRVHTIQCTNKMTIFKTLAGQTKKEEKARVMCAIVIS